MKIIALIILGIYLNTTAAQTPLGTEFTYQGELKNSIGNPHDGSFDFQFEAFDTSAENTGASLGFFTAQDVQVTDGIFSTQINFGGTAFLGDKVWLEISVRDGASTGIYTQLLPRQQVTATPYATHAQFVGADAIGSLEIQDGSITSIKLANNAVTTDKIDDGAVSSDDLADDAVVSSKIVDATIINADISDNAITTTKLDNNAVTQDKLEDNSVGAAQVISSEVQLRLTGGCTQGQYVSAVNANGIIQCTDAIDASARGVCKTSSGVLGIIINNVCVLEYSNLTTNNWNSAVNNCSALGGDLCSVSQYQAIRYKSALNLDLFFNQNPVWTNDFSDNDSGLKSSFLRSADDPSINNTHGYACCGNVLPEPTRSLTTNINGVNTAFIHTQEDTTWVAASNMCVSLGSDLCSKSQYVSLNDANVFNSTTKRRATADMSDNDGFLLSSVVGSNTADNPNALHLYAFACCGMSNKPVDLSCPGAVTSGGVCIESIHDVEDSNFFDAARACHNQGADLCSKSQMQSLRNSGDFIGECWTNDGADNDLQRVGGLLSTQPDNPDLISDLFGYACCY